MASTISRMDKCTDVFLMVKFGETGSKQDVVCQTLVEEGREKVCISGKAPGFLEKSIPGGRSRLCDDLGQDFVPSFCW